MLANWRPDPTIWPTAFCATHALFTTGSAVSAFSEPRPANRATRASSSCVAFARRIGALVVRRDSAKVPSATPAAIPARTPIATSVSQLRRNSARAIASTTREDMSAALGLELGRARGRRFRDGHEDEDPGAPAV